MKAWLRIFVVFITFCTLGLNRVEAVSVTLSVLNDIRDEEDPIRLKAVHFSIGQIEEISHEEGQAIGKEFRIKVDLPSIQGMNYLEYKDWLVAQGQELDSLVFCNQTREFGFTVFLGFRVALEPISVQNIQCSYLGSSQGFHIYDY